MKVVGRGVWPFENPLTGEPGIWYQHGQVSGVFDADGKPTSTRGTGRAAWSISAHSWSDLFGVTGGQLKIETGSSPGPGLELHRYPKHRSGPLRSGMCSCVRVRSSVAAANSGSSLRLQGCAALSS